MLWDAVAENITNSIGFDFHNPKVTPLSGGCINQAFLLEADGLRYFVKTNQAHQLAMFEAEADGLEELLSANAIKIPRPICWGQAGSAAYLVLHALELGGPANPEQMGHNLAMLHRKTAGYFGWFRDNTIGSTAQINRKHATWVEFWQQNRLGYQLNLCKQKGVSSRLLDRGERLMADCEQLFDSYLPIASLCHGDLWGGNADYEHDGTPVIFDPAVYYGDRETDLAMTRLFGGFGEGFYRAYNDAWPLDDGFTVRKTFYNLYHILNHYVLFGGSYAHQAEHMLDQVLAEIH